MYSRKERRAIAKQLGLLGKSNESTDKWINRIKRSKDAGAQLHAQHLADQERIAREKEAESNIVEIDNPDGADGVVEGKVVGYEPLSSDDDRSNQDLSDFGIQA